jgi:hypothetical protein
MDPLSCLGIASSIVQFVDFGLRVVSKGKQIYRSVDGSLAENLDLEIVTNDLLVLQAKLQCFRTAASSPQSDSYNANAFETLSRACADLAVRLLERLNMAKAQGRFRRWKSLRQALKSVWSKQDIEEMANRLHRFRSELQLHILVSLKCVESIRLSLLFEWMLSKEQASN